MRSPFFFTLGLTSLALGMIGAFLPLLPTVPFILLAAFCFARSSPGFERRMIAHKHFGPHIMDWRDSRAISRSGKRAAWVAFAFSGAAGFILLPLWWSLIPLLVALAGSAWIASLRTAGS